MEKQEKGIFTIDGEVLVLGKKKKKINLLGEFARNIQYAVTSLLGSLGFLVRSTTFPQSYFMVLPNSLLHSTSLS
jgi:hypothetical protein